MSNALSTAALIAMFAANAGSEVLLCLLELSHPSWSTKRYVNDTVSIVSGGNTYNPFPFEVPPPTDSLDLSNVTLVLHDLQRELLPNFRAVSSGKPVTATMKMILASAPDTILRTWVLEIRGISYTATSISCTCRYDTVAYEAVPGDDMNPRNNPGHFKESE